MFKIITTIHFSKIFTLVLIIVLNNYPTKAEQTTEITDTPFKVYFKLERKRVIIPTSVNGSQKLNLILDTGMRFDGVYLFHEEFVDDIDTTGAIEVRVPGAGAGEASTALMIENGRIAFGDISIDSQRVIISKSSHTQSFPTDGVIGWNLFGHYAVEINYDKEIITLHDSKKLDVDNFWSIVPITMRKDIPFLDCIVEVVEGESVKMSLYIDLASDEALELLTGKEQRFSLPDVTEEMYLGTGLSGDIYGMRGHSKMLRISSFELFNVTTAFAPSEIRSKQEAADGVIGNDFIRRFNVIFDYENGFLFLKPNSYFKTPFE